MAAEWHPARATSPAPVAALRAALLPARLPVLPGLQVGGVLVPGDSAGDAGGDWLTSVALPDGRLGVAVGRVAGHGIPACAAMGQLRAVLEDHLRAGDDLTAALAALHAYAAAAPGAGAATLCLAFVDPESGAVEYGTAGHPPPLVVVGAEWSFLEPTGCTPLGWGPRQRPRTAHLPVGGALVLHTDGLIAAAGASREQGTAAIGREVSATCARVGAPPFGDHPPLEALCEQSVARLTRGSGHAHDITVLAIRRAPPRPPLSLEVEGDAAGPRRLDAELTQWLQGVGAGEEDHRDLRQAVGELVTNSVEHGAPGRSSGPFLLHLRAEHRPDGSVRIRLRDTGVWREEATTSTTGARFRGLGLALASQLVDALEVARGSDGTMVTVLRRLGRPVLAPPQGSQADGEARPAPPGPALTVVDRHPGRVALRGPAVDRTAGVLRDLLDIETRAGTRDLTVELTEVTQLTGASVRLLLVAAGRASRNGSTLAFLAPAGSVAADVLRLSGIAVEPAGTPPPDPEPAAPPDRPPLTPS